VKLVPDTIWNSQICHDLRVTWICCHQDVLTSVDHCVEHSRISLQVQHTYIHIMTDSTTFSACDQTCSYSRNPIHKKISARLPCLNTSFSHSDHRFGL